MTASSNDPPEYGYGNAGGRGRVRGIYGDPPTASDGQSVSSASASGYNAGGGGTSLRRNGRHAAASPPSSAAAPVVAGDNARSHRDDESYHDDLASMQCASSVADSISTRRVDNTAGNGGSNNIGTSHALPPTGGGGVVVGGNNFHPASVLRNGNGGTAPSPSISSITLDAREMRNKRITSSRRGGGMGNVQHFKHHDDDFPGGHGNCHDQMIHAIDAVVPHTRSRFLVAVSGLAALVAVVGLGFDPITMAGAAAGSALARGVDPGAGGSAGTTSLGSRSLKQNAVEAAAESSVHMASTGSDFKDDFDQRRRRAADLPDGTVFSEPAHTRMCRTIVERLDAYDSGVTAFEQIIFTESEYVCRDPDAPYTSVLNMFAAELLDGASDQLGLNVDYTHRCAKWERYCTGNMTTIQFHLPDPLSTTAYAFQEGCLDAANLRTICSGCLASDDPTNPDCVLFPGGYLDVETNTCDLGCYFSQVLPWIRNNLRTVATNWLNTVETRALTFWLRNAAEFSHREKDDMEVSVVSLSCGNDDCDMSMETCVCEFDPLPNWVYAMHIPRSSTNVAILVSPTCAKFGEGCTLHAQELYHFFGQLYPRADITYNVITSTSSMYMRMITADHLVCPPGVGCLLPAIARDAFTYVYETTDPTVGTWLTCTPQDYINRLTIPSFPPEFVQGDCRHLRARLGSWTSDLDLASSLQYASPVDGYLGCADANFVATAEDPYRAPTTYRWDETIWATCPVEVTSKDEMCTQMDRLGLTRALFVGDHTTMSQAISLVSILGYNADISLDPNVVPNFTKTIFCTNGVANFDVTYIRNDRLEEPGTTPSPGSPNCGPTGEQYCYPWSNDYSNWGEDKQLLIVNTGYHWGEDWQGYITNFQNFVGQIDTIAAATPARANDVIMFRTSVPGHKECHLHDGVYAHYGEYCPRIVNGAFWHWWGELPPYNDYAIRIINEWNLLNTVKSGANIELLDPWYMTVLRPDGHLSGIDAGESCTMDPQECMLYSLPGPTDWWNHLLIMQLKDIGTHLENSTPLQAWR